MKARIGFLGLCGLAAAQANVQGHLSLEQALQIAKSNSFVVKQSVAKLDEANAHVESLSAGLMPRVYGNAYESIRSVNPGAQSPTYPSMILGPFQVQDARLGAKWTLDLAAIDRKKYARQNAQEISVDTNWVGANLSWSTALSYVQLAKVQTLKTARQEEKKLADELAVLTEELRKSGAATRVDELRARGQVLSADLALSLVDGQLQKARLDLASSLNTSLAPEVQVDLDTSDFAGVTAVQDLENFALEHRTELAQLDVQKKSMEREIQAVHREFLPTVDVGADYGLSGRNLVKNGELTGNVMVALNWNFWDGGRRQSRAAEMGQKLRQTDFQRNDLQSKIRAEIQTVVLGLRESRKTLILIQQRQKLAQEEIQIAKERYKAGATGCLEVIQSQQSAALIDEQWIDALVQVQLSKLALRKAIAQL